MPPSSQFPPPSPEWTDRIGNLVRYNGNDHRESSVRLYLEWLWRLYKKSGTQHDVTNVDWLVDPATVLSYLGPQVKPSTQAAYMKAVLNLLLGLQLRSPSPKMDAVYRAWLTAYTDISNQAKKGAFESRRIQHVPASLTLTTLQDWLQEQEDEIATWTAPLTTEQCKQLLQHLYVAWMVGHPDFPPVRAEYQHLPIVYGNGAAPSANYLRVPPHLQRTGRWELVLGDYKTVREYGVHRRTVPIPLREVLRRSLTLFPRDYFLSRLRDGSKPVGDLSFLVTDIVPDVSLGVSTLRALFIRDYAAHQPMERQLWLARQMMHDIKTSIAVYRGGGEP